jgi:hypothetical protein
MPARIDQCLYCKPGEPVTSEFFKGEDAVDFVSVFGGDCLLLVIVVPDFFDEGEFGCGEFTGFGTSDIPPIGCITRSTKKIA